MMEDLGPGEWDCVLVTTHNRTWGDDLVSATLNGSNRIGVGEWRGMLPEYRRVFSEIGIGIDCPYDQMIPVPERSHEVEKYAVLAGELIGDASVPQPQLRVSEFQRKAARHILDSLKLEVGRFCFCCPVGNQKVIIKNWPPGRFAEVIAWMEKEHGLPTLVVGHRFETENVQQVLALARESGANPRLWMGRDGEIPLLAALVASARFYLGNDTGPMHVAAAVKVPVVAIFGGGTWPRFLPQGDTSVAIAGDMPCFGCGWECLFDDAPCMSLVAVKDVKKAAGPLCGGSRPRTIGAKVMPASTKLGEEAGSYIRKVVQKVGAIEEDRRARLRAIECLERQVRESEADRAARLEVIQKLERELHEVEADRAARLEVIQELERQLQEGEADRAARLEVIQRLERQLQESEADRAARLEVIQRLELQLQESEADRAARLEVIQRLEQQLQESEADRAARLEVIHMAERQLQAREADQAVAWERVHKLESRLGELENSVAFRLLKKLHLAPQADRPSSKKPRSLFR